jgi:hypothetical protein
MLRLVIVIEGDSVGIEEILNIVGHHLKGSA